MTRRKSRPSECLANQGRRESAHSVRCAKDADMDAREELLRQGHRCPWWASTHSHQRKVLLFDEDREVEVAQGFRLKLLFAGAYRRNLSLGRMLHHSRLAAKFRRLAPRFPDRRHRQRVPDHRTGVRGRRIRRSSQDPRDHRHSRSVADILLDSRRRRSRARPNRDPPAGAKARIGLARSDSLVACSRGFLTGVCGSPASRNARPTGSFTSARR